MIRSALLALVLLFAQDPKPGWQTRLETASRNGTAWKTRREDVKRQILVAAGLWPEFERPPLKPDIFGKVEGEDYTIERVSIETLPGFYLSGGLYRPKGKPGPYPAIAAPHGHWKEGRYTQAKDGNFPTMGINLARLGFVSFHYDMVGYADFKQLPHKFEDPAFGQGLFGLQTWNSLRAIDFIAALPDVDPKRIGCTGASGGGTQTFILAAIDDRIACAAPVNMVAAEFQGGCSCENAPFLRLGLNNVEIAAMTAPRPLLLIACTGDWTKNIPTLEAPVVKKAFETLGVGEKFLAIQFTAPHNYNQDSREAMYAWMVRWLQKGPDQLRIAETPAPEVKREELAVWTGDHPLPGNAVNADSLKTLLREKVTAQLAALQPKDAASLKKFRDLLEPAWRVMLSPQPPADPGNLGDGGLTTVVVTTRAEDAAPYQQQLSAGAKPGDGHMKLVLGEPYKPEPTAGGNAEQRKGYPATFYRSDLARQVQDVTDLLTALNRPGKASQVRIVALGDAALPVLLARAISPSRVNLAVIDLSTIDAAVEASKHPGLHRLGGWQGAAMLAPAGLTVLHGKKFDAGPIRAAYKAAGRDEGITISEEAWSRDRVVQELAR